jgi:uncharacterized damage-inducible protein DinB
LEVQDISLLFEYNYWARDKILDQAFELSTGEFVSSVESIFGSLQATLVHILGAEWVWRVRCQERNSPSSLPSLEDYPSVKSLQETWIQEQLRMEQYLRELEDDDLFTTITYKRTGGEERSNTLWHLMIHVILHGTEHRSEAGSILTSFGHSPGDIDFIHFLRARG